MLKKILTYFLLFFYSFGNISVFFVYADDENLGVEQNNQSQEENNENVKSDSESNSEGQDTQVNDKNTTDTEINSEGQEQKGENGSSTEDSQKSENESTDLQENASGNSEIDEKGTQVNDDSGGNSETQDENENQEIDFEGKVIFQNPSYLLEKDEEDRDFYTCDEAKEKCKMNLKFLGILDGKELTSSKYICETNFGMETDEKDKCNPKTIVFPEGETTVSYKIILKSEDTVFKEGDFIIKNISSATDSTEDGENKEDENLNDESESNTEGQESDEQNQEEPENGEGNEETEGEEEKLLLPELKLEIQSGADFGENNQIICPEKGDGVCKINFTLGEIDAKKISCRFDFGTGTLMNQEQKCNPSYVDFGAGKFQMKVQIFETGNEQNIVEKNFIVENETPTSNDETGDSPTNSEGEEENEPNPDDNSENQDSAGEENNLVELPKNPEIKIQSGLSESLTCDKKLCSVNLIYENPEKDLACLWDFGAGEIGKTKIDSCNPGYVKFAPGKHTISLKIYQKNHENNFIEQKLAFENTYKIRHVNAKITLQGKLAKYKELTKDGIICYGKKVCKLNFTGADSKGEIEDWYWNFGNGENFYDKNPKSIEFAPGKYKVTLNVFDERRRKSEDEFLVEVREEKRKIENKNLELDFKSFLDTYFKIFITNENEKIIEAKKEQLLEQFKLYYRKNKQYGTTYGRYTPAETLLITKKHRFLDGIFYSKDYVVPVGENGKYREKLPYDVSGNFIIEAYILDRNLGKIFAGEKQIEVEEQDRENGKKFLEKMKNENIKSKEKIEEISPHKLLGAEKKEHKKIIPKITLQGKIGKNKSYKGETLTCLGRKTCSVNFDGRESSGDFVEIFWDFGNGKTSSKINPKSVKYEKVGNYHVSLVLRDKFGEKYEERFKVQFIPKAKKKRKTRKRSSNKKSRKVKIGPVQLKIEVQGRIGKNKVLQENNLTCIGSCSVNFDGRKSSGAYKKLFWDFGNGEVFAGENPGYIKYGKLGIYTVKLYTNGYDGKKYEKSFTVKFVENKSDGDTGTHRDIENPDKGNKNIKQLGKNNEKNSLEVVDIMFIGGILVMMISGSGVILKKYKII